MSITRRTILKGSAAAVGGLLVPMPHIMRKASAADTITLGVVTPLSGPQQLLGNYVKLGAEIGVDWVNANGGIGGKQVRLEIRDDKANPNDATVVTRELLGDGVTLHLGAIASPVSLVMGPLMQQEGGVHLTSGAGSEKLNHENYNEHVFRVGDGPYSRNAGLVRHIIQTNPDIDTWGGIIPDHEYGRTTWAIFVDAMQRFYPELTGKQPKIEQPIMVPYGSGDYKNFITQAVRLPVKGIYTSVYGGDAVTLYQQAKPFGLFDKLDILLDSANEFLAAKALGKETPVHWTGCHWYFETNKGNPLSDNLYEEYVKRAGDKYPMGWAAEAQAGVLAYKAAIEKTGGSTEAADVIAALKGLTFDSATGKRTIRAEDNQAIKNAEIIKIGPSDTAESGFEVTDYVSLDGNAIIEPPSPGKRMELKPL
jgi:branched-chain amino acid transport system substrate-binding protein